MIELFPAFEDDAVNCACRRWLFEVFLSPSSDFHDRTVSVFNAVSPERLKITSIPYRFLALSFTLWDFQHLLMILSTVHEKVQVFIIVKLFHNLWTQFVAEWWISAHPYSWETLLVKDALFCPGHVTDLLSIHLISCKIFPQLFLFRTTYFSSLCCLDPSFCFF